MTTLPIDLIADIFLLLPAKTLLRFKIVCKLWYNLINDVNFINRHLEQSIATKTNLHFVITTPLLHLVDFDTFENPVKLNPFHGNVCIVGSCNGLLCISSYGCDSKFVAIYNPTTRTYKLPPRPDGPLEGRFDYGFGFDSVSEDYKCVRIVQNYNMETGSSSCEVMVYSLKNDSWRKGPDVPHFFYTREGTSALLHETVHWVGNGGGDDRLPRPIVAFNLNNEKFSSLSLPDFDAEGLITVNLGVLDGCLSVFHSYSDASEVWIMKDYGVAGSWKKIFNVPNGDYGHGHCLQHLDRIISYSRTEKELFVRIYFLQVARFDLEKMVTTKVKVANFRKCYDAHLCVENLLRLDNADYYSVQEELLGDKKRKKKRSQKRNSR